MLDLSHLPPSQSSDVQTFTIPSTATQTQWHSWVKPRGASMTYMLCIGGGGGGGHGAGTGGTGSGGGSGAQSVLLIPSLFLPDRLYVQIGAGGGSEVNGVASIISSVPNTNTNNYYLIANGGTAGTQASGAGGAGGTISAIGNCPLAGLGFYNFYAGQIGATQTTSAPGTSINPLTTGLIVTGGASGGGGSGNAGGGINTAPTYDFMPTIPALDSAPTGGYISWKPLFFFGGSGGGGTTPNDGGNGAYGCGGGGGGARTGSLLGGTGGNGIVIIISW